MQVRPTTRASAPRRSLASGWIWRDPDACASPQAQSAEEQVLIRLENDLNAAFLKRDSTFLKAVAADDYVTIYGNGSIHTKAQDLAMLSNYRITSSVLSDVTVRVCCDGAVVTYLATQTGTINGREMSGVGRVTDVLVKRVGRWRTVLTQETRVAAR